MSSNQDHLIHTLLGHLEIETTLFHLGQYCGSWKASTTGLARAGFHLVLNGDCWLHLPADAQHHRLQTGDAVFFLRDVAHFLSPHADITQAAAAPRCPMAALDFTAPESTALACGFFTFRAPMTQLFLGALPPYVVIERDAPQLAELTPLFKLILNEAQTAGKQASPLINRLVDVLFFYVLRHLVQRGEVPAGPWAVLAQPEFSPLIEAIIASPERPWTLEEMADLCHMSRATFCKRFSQTAGTSPANFVGQIRMKLATQMMRHGLSLSRIAERVGYQSDAAFSRAFKKLTGQLPGVLRRNALASQRLAA